MATVDGKVVMRAPDGRLYRVPDDQVALQQQDQKWTVAPDAAVEARQAERDQYAQYGSTGQQALGAVETATRAATLGLVPGFGSKEDVAGREGVLRKESPIVHGLAQAAGTIAPALAGGALAEGAIGAAGLGAGELALPGALGESIAVPTTGVLGAGGRAAVQAGAEGLAGGAAQEIDEARYQARDVSAGNIFLAGLGGALIGHALPKALELGAGRVRAALTPVEAAAGEGIPNALSRAEANSVRSEAGLATELPKGSPERAAALRRTAGEQYDKLAPKVAEDIGGVVDAAKEFSTSGASAKRVAEKLRDAMPDESPAQVEWFTGAKQRLNDAKTALRAPLEEVTTPTREAYLAGIEDAGERRAADRQIAREIQVRGREAGLDAAVPGPEWDKLEQSVMTERARAEAPRLSEALGKRAGEFDALIDQGLRRLDKTSDPASQFLVARTLKSDLQRFGDSLGKAPGAAAEQARALVQQTWQDIRQGLGDESLFGRAARIERDLSGAGQGKLAEGLSLTEQDLGRKVGEGATEFDPGKVRGFLKKDALDRQVTRDKLEKVLEGAEDIASAHETHGTASAADIAAQRARIGRVREALGLSDEIQFAEREGKAAAATAQAAKATGEAGAKTGHGRAGELAEFGLEHLVNHVVPGAGSLLRLGKRLASMDQAGRTATRQAARNLAGTGLGYAARAAGTASEFATAPVTTALARFTGDYSGPEESFAAKKQLIDDATVQPEVLYDTLAHGLGDLPKVHPELFQEIAARTSEKLRFVRDNLPPGLQTSLLYPNGTPPSRSDLRDYAVLWNTVMEPQSVIDDLNAGTASPQQMRILQHSDPDLYGQLRSDALQEIGQNFAHVPTVTKLSLDILFDADGLAGPMFSSAAADMIGAARDAQKSQRPNANAPMTSKASELAHAQAPTGIGAIKTSVTNRGVV